MSRRAASSAQASLFGDAPPTGAEPTELAAGAAGTANRLVEPIEALRPEAGIVLQPFRDFAQGRRIEPARPPLRLAATLDKPRLLEHLQVQPSPLTCPFLYGEQCFQEP